MKKNLVFIWMMAVLHITTAQDISGKWFGTLNIEGTYLDLIFTIKKSDKGYAADISVPAQGANDIPMSHATFQNNQLSLALDNPGMYYDGVYKNKSFEGNFKQGGRSLPLKLTKDPTAKPEVKKPQEPKPPYPYLEEEVTFQNKTDKIQLSGTLTKPAVGNNFTAIVLISGSGPQNREEEIMGHKPFKVIADFLTRQGFVVLRYDDRGVGKSSGNYNQATTYDLANDAEAAYQYLKQRKDVSKVFLMGHSEGGIIAPIVAFKNETVDGLILLAAPGLRGDSLLLQQQAYLAKASGMSDADLTVMSAINRQVFSLVMQTPDTAALNKAATAYMESIYDSLSEEQRPQGISKKDFIQVQVMQITSPWMRTYLKHDPAIILQKIHCPILALYGEKDLQVPPQKNAEVLKNACAQAKNTQVRVKIFPGLNHLFQPCKIGIPDEYAASEITFSKEVMEEMGRWLKSLQGK